ncbi:MAG: hypothetical protein SH819_03920 [Cytophagales bacterium]|nr:hypothetical protein [Cytophagales bacterium]
MGEMRNKYLAGSSAVLLTVSVTLFLSTREVQKPAIDPAYFAVTDTEQVDRVTLATADDTVALTFDGSRWRVNNRWDADVQMIKVLMATLRQAEVHRAVPVSMVDTVTRQLDRLGIQVSVQEAGIERIRFLAGGNPQKTESWFLKEGEARPYIMIIPGYRVFVSGILELKEGGWRNKRIFEFNWRNFKTLTASYANEPAAGFTVEMKQRYFGIREVKQVDTTKLNDYLDAVSLLVARRFVNGRSDSLPAVKPAARIDITDIADRTYSLELFPAGAKDTEVYGRMADGQRVAFDRDVVTALLRRRGYFVSSDRR